MAQAILIYMYFLALVFCGITLHIQLGLDHTLVFVDVLPRRWEDLSLDDIDIRFKWAGLFHRAKRTPKKFMMRIKVCGRKKEKRNG